MSLRRAAILLLLLLPAAATAHTRGTSYSQWDLDATPIAVQARVSQLELTRLALDPRTDRDYASKVGAILQRDLILESSAGPCTTPAPATLAVGSDGWATARWTLDCPARDVLTVRTRLLESVAPSHLHFVRVTHNGAVAERVLSFGAPAFSVVRSQPPASATVHFVRLGIDHILSGWDHLAFVLALVLLSRRLRDVALIATGFTVAHSVTLAAAVLGWAQVSQPRVEALIGFSIAVVAVENLWWRAGRDPWLPRLLLVALAASAILLPWSLAAGLVLFCACYFALTAESASPLAWRTAIAALFGLVHGFGFAGALAELELPRAQLAAGLLGFNVGVEVGQLLVIALAWPLLLALRRRPRWDAVAQPALSTLLVALGTFWFVGRSLA